VILADGAAQFRNIVGAASDDFRPARFTKPQASGRPDRPSSIVARSRFTKTEISTAPTSTRA
jgi:hypothetical protein